MISIKKVSICNFLKVSFLKPGKKNKKYIKPNFYSIITSIFERKSKLLAIYLDKQAIGFCMLSKFIEPLYIHRFMIGEKYQNKGFGKQAIKKLIEYIKENYDIDKVLLSTASYNAKKFYLKSGFYYVYTEPYYAEMYNKYGEELLEYAIK